MRRFVFILASALVASAAHAAPACDAARIGAKELADCLRAASDISERDLTAALASALKSIDAQPKMLSSRKARWKRFLNDSQAQWVSLRDEECQDLAPLEAPTASGSDPRLTCLIDRNTRRAKDLRARYP